MAEHTLRDAIRIETIRAKIAGDDNDRIELLVDDIGKMLRIDMGSIDQEHVDAAIDLVNAWLVGELIPTALEEGA